ncbi:hypothetical protein OSB04_028383 [Centaurea solstitialis]|uniref:F-box domain-containing protein n=1 Tax=Centaurea solstitialis TaxID=347529 RepID=A0AA38W0K3_9ASTR|nr:hypothetical protein OSB04_028383 [Centaurea solstitialis]
MTDYLPPPSTTSTTSTTTVGDLNHHYPPSSCFPQPPTTTTIVTTSFAKHGSTVLLFCPVQYCPVLSSLVIFIFDFISSLFLVPLINATNIPKIKTSLKLLSLDILVEIIKRLLVKTLIQIRSVCKAWKSLIDSSEFIAGYGDDQPQHLMTSYRFSEENGVKYVCFVDDDTFRQQKFFLTIPHMAREAIVIGSSHGLLCLDGLSSRASPEMDIVLLWNPSIRKAIVVDVSHRSLYSYIRFGVCPDTKDPKLVKITYIGDRTKMRTKSCIPCKVMKCTTSCTNKLPPLSFQFGSNEQTTVGQFIYWLAGRSDNLIMSFDLSTDEFREIELPHSLRQSKLSISSVRESVVLLVYYNTNTTNKGVCDVWMMEHGDPKTFTKLYTIKPPHASVFLTPGFRDNGEPIIVMYDDFHPQCSLVVYEPCLEHIKDLGIRGYRYSLSGGFYTESLLLLNYDDGRIEKPQDEEKTCGRLRIKSTFHYVSPIRGDILVVTALIVLEALERKSTKKGGKAWKLSKVNSEASSRPQVFKSRAAKRATTRRFMFFTDFASTLEIFAPRSRQEPSMEDSRTCLKRKSRVI